MKHRRYVTFRRILRITLDILSVIWMFVLIANVGIYERGTLVILH